MEERLIYLQIDEIKYRDGMWVLYGPYTAGFEGKTIMDAIQNAEKQLDKHLTTAST